MRRANNGSLLFKMRVISGIKISTVALVILLSNSCVSSSTSLPTVYREVKKIKGSAIECIYGKEFENEKYIILMKPINDPYDYIRVYNKTTDSTYILNENFCNLIDIIEGQMIIDSGSGATRGLTIYQLTNGEIIFKTNYYGILKIDGKLIKFDAVYSLSKESIKPHCGIEYDGFTEEQVYDLSTFVLSKSGNYKCAHLE